MANLLYLNQYITTTLSAAGGITDSQTTGIVLASTASIDTTKPGIALLTYADPLDTSKAEWVEYSSINSSTKALEGVVRASEGFAAKAHDNGAAIAFPISESHINRLNNAVEIGGSATNPITGFLDEDDMSTNSATKGATQQSIKAFVDGKIIDEDDMASNLNTKVPTQQSVKAYVDNSLSSLSSKVISATRDLTVATGDVNYTGVGFQPSVIIAFAALGGGTEGQSWGMCDSSSTERAITRGSNGLGYVASVICSVESTAGALQSAVVKSFDADGFTLTWTKTGSPTGTATIYFLCLK